jgi:hypothetical protein
MADISTIEQAGWFLLETYPPKQKKLDSAIASCGTASRLTL